MTPNEFKAWFDGFTEAFAGCPTKAQWTRIKACVAEIDGKPVTERVYIDRYAPYYRPYWQYLGNGIATCGSLTVAQSATTGAMQAGQAHAAYSNAIGSGGQAFNSLAAMTELGRTEAVSMSNAA